MDYFGRKERMRQRAFAAKRDKLFAPIIDVLAATKATPNMVSALGVLFLILGCVMPGSWHPFVLACLALYVVCDGLDGPLARRLGKDHSGGALVDVVADQVGVVFLAAAAIVHIRAWGPAMVLFSSSYLVFIGLVLYANGIGAALRWFFRCKYLFFGLYWLSLALARDLVTWFGAFFALYYAVESTSALRRIYALHAARASGGGDSEHRPS